MRDEIELLLLGLDHRDLIHLTSHLMDGWTEFAVTELIESTRWRL